MHDSPEKVHPHRLALTMPLALGYLWLCCIGMGFTISTAKAQSPSTEFVLAAHQQSLAPVIISPKASQRVKQAANELAYMLGRMTKTTFKVQEGDGSKGIIIGLPGDFNQLPAAIQPAFDRQDSSQQQRYMIQSTTDGLFLLGASEVAVEHALWDCLERLGFRQFFPGKHWEIVPHHSRMAMSLKVDQSPDYIQRIMVAPGGSFHDKKQLDAWQHRNRTSEDEPEMHNRFFWSFYMRNRSVFEKHPEYLGLRHGERLTRKFCLSNPQLRELMIDFAIKTLQNNPKLKSMSLTPMSPRAGRDWCECANCEAVGGPADNVITLANLVAKHPLVVQRDATIYITAGDAMLTPPESVDLHPRLAVTLVLPTLLTLDYENKTYWQTQTREQLDGWRKRKAQNLGVMAIIGGPTGMTDPTLESLRVTLPFLHAQGVNRVHIDVGEYWGNIGLANYVTSQILWDIQQANHIDTLTANFFNQSFGSAAPAMRQYFQQLACLSSRRPVALAQVFGENRIKSMYQMLAQALSQTTSPQIRSRICDLAAHTRVLELQARVHQASKETLQTHSDELMQFVFQTRDRGMSPAYEMFSSPLWYGVQAHRKTNAKTPVAKHPWKQPATLNDQQLMTIVNDAVARYNQKGKDQ